MKFSNEDLMLLLNGERDFDIQIETDKMCESIVDNLFSVYKKYMLWSYEEFESAVDFIESCYEERQNYLNTTHKGIFERMKEHTSKRGMSYGEKLVKRVLDNEGYLYKQECYIGHSFEDIHDGSIKLDFVVFYNEKLYVIEYNGKQHYNAVEDFGGAEQFTKQQQNDALKREFCKRYNIELLEIPYTINTDEEVTLVIKDFLK